jgi:hypothetical protein
MISQLVTVMTTESNIHKRVDASSAIRDPIMK